VLKSPRPFVLFEDFGDSALMFSLNYYITDSFSDPKIKSAMRYSIDAKFRANSIQIPFPQRDVHLFRADALQPRSIDAENNAIKE
jgi:small-conductance mechanosensitive channel